MRAGRVEHSSVEFGTSIRAILLFPRISVIFSRDESVRHSLFDFTGFSFFFWGGGWEGGERESGRAGVGRAGYHR